MKNVQFKVNIAYELTSEHPLLSLLSLLFCSRELDTYLDITQLLLVFDVVVLNPTQG